MLHAIIMAGGTGTRFWPASTNDTPKQLLQLVGDSTMLRQTIDRLGNLVPSERTLVVTNERLVSAVRKQLPELPAQSIIGEPCKRDTAPCIGLAALLVSRNDPAATMLVMPADHVIRPPDAFQSAIRQAAGLVEESPQRIVTIGITPAYATEGFGYIHRGKRLTSSQKLAPAYAVERFKEKPDAATAQGYLASGEYYWNSGIFVWRAETILHALRDRQPQMIERLERIVADWDSQRCGNTFQREFSTIEPISIDYAVMEHATDVAVIEAPFEWDDLGGWQSLARQHGVDANGNAIIGRHLGVNTSGTIVRGEDGHLIVTLGLKDCIVVHTPNATLVASKHDEEQIRKVVKQLEELGLDRVSLISEIQSNSWNTEVLVVLEDLLGFFCCLAGGASLIFATVSQFRAAENRNPGVSRTRARWMFTLLLRDDLYNEQGQLEWKKCIRGLALFFLFCGLVVVIEVIAGLYK
jgi:mannose-1-phosphate guanylyltransferase